MLTRAQALAALADLQARVDRSGLEPCELSVVEDRGGKPTITGSLPGFRDPRVEGQVKEITRLLREVARLTRELAAQKRHSGDSPSPAGEQR